MPFARFPSNIQKMSGEPQVNAPGLPFPGSLPDPVSEPGLKGSGRRRPPAVDVWSHKSRRSRTLAVVLLIINWGLFCGLCVFSFWLHFAQLYDFSLASYLEPFRFWGPQSQTLNDFVSFPINVVERPEHALVLGTLLAAIVAVPISVAILFGFPAALPFLASVLVFAHLPWLSVTLLGSCILAAVRPFRLRFRFGAALVGLIPVVVYLVLASRGGRQTIESYASPEERQMLVAPWVLAIFGASVMLGLILGLAKLVNYRPAVVTPIIAGLFATPVVLFHRYVGADELAYHVLLRNHGPHSAAFEPLQDAKPYIFEMLHGWTQAESSYAAGRGETLIGLWSGDESIRLAVKERVAARMIADLLEARRDAYEAGKRFIADYPRSRYLPCVLFMQARAFDTRLAEPPLLGSSPIRELYFDFPHVQSQITWEKLLARYPGSPLAVIAGLRAAQLSLRRGDPADALIQIERALTPPLASQPLPGPELTLELDLEAYRIEAQTLRELIRENMDDPQFGVAPLAEFAGDDPRRPGYERRLRDLMSRFPTALLADNLAVRWSSMHPDLHQRAVLLEHCAEHFPNGDARSESSYRLAELEVLTLSRDEPQLRERGLTRLRELISARESSVWAARARRLIERVEPVTPATAMKDRP